MEKSGSLVESYTDYLWISKRRPVLLSEKNLSNLRNFVVPKRLVGLIRVCLNESEVKSESLDMFQSLFQLKIV